MARGPGAAMGAWRGRAGAPLRLLAWLHHHRRSASDSLRRLFRNALASLMTWLAIGIALALPVGMSVALDNSRSLSANLEGAVQFSLFMSPGASLEAARRLRESAAARADVATARLVPRDEALREFQRLSGFGDALRRLDDNPLPHVVLVTPLAERPDAGAARAMRRALAELPGAERVLLDMEWVQRLHAMVRLSERAVSVLSALLALGVLLVIGNPIRLALESRRDEIVIVKLVGGSDSFVRRPFLYTGLWYGLGGAAVAWLIIAASLWWLSGPLANLTALYQSGFRMRGLGLTGGLQLLALGGLLGLVGAWLAVSRRLGAIQPG